MFELKGCFIDIKSVHFISWVEGPITFPERVESYSFVVQISDNMHRFLFDTEEKAKEERERLLKAINTDIFDILGIK